jgi:hypothetical protein
MKSKPAGPVNQGRKKIQNGSTDLINHFVIRIS